MIEVKKLFKTYGRQAVLRDVSWCVRKGEFWGLIGPNGSGKTTLLNLISGVERPDAGEIALEGQPLSSYGRKALSRKIAVLQQDGLPPVSYSVRDVVEMGRFPYQDWRGREKDGPEATRRLLGEIMDKLELTALEDRPLSALSGGQRQRAALGKVMAQQPELVLLDEPTTYLDLRYQMQFMELVAGWQREEGLTVVAVMHDLNLAALFCDRLLVLSEGRIVAEGPPQDILSTAMVEEVYQVKAHRVPHPDSGVPQLLLQRRKAESGDAKGDWSGETGN
ncbi:ABC transporter ATP-binding protein [Paenibacillus macerans]|uniref:ABC transporter ATP-binding protein n=1 Tax=Paenibacillus macerans TaxID=44252 RepID=UPI002041104B|nr:ABC transporter ATP-binding protein [Paenibacillus macerans]MCM3699879.1 ABC transporter ATP-binding protein [Paenibacillus macerans]